MPLLLRHLTSYHYREPVVHSHNQARLLLREADGQQVLQRSLRISPSPSHAREYRDMFGNRVIYFEIDRPHRCFRILARHLVRRTPAPLPDPADSPPWEAVAEQLCAPERAAQRLWVLPSRLAPVDATLADFAREHFRPGVPLLAGAEALSRHIHQTFRFDPRATSVTTPVHEVLERRRGVCQDFAQMMIAALRSIGLAARYVSGYLETRPPPGHPRLVGADASHAWVAVWCPVNGWQEFDPTNDMRPGTRHIVCAHGRDYEDVMPLNGVIEGGGESSLRVAVDVMHRGEVIAYDTSPDG